MFTKIYFICDLVLQTVAYGGTFFSIKNLTQICWLGFCLLSD